jgi:hypothetical protein
LQGNLANGSAGPAAWPEARRGHTPEEGAGLPQALIGAEPAVEEVPHRPGSPAGAPNDR